MPSKASETIESLGDQLSNGTSGKKFTDHLGESLLLYKIGDHVVTTEQYGDSNATRAIVVSFDAWNTKKGTADFTIHGEEWIFSQVISQSLDKNPFLIGVLAKGGRAYKMEPLPEEHADIIRKNWGVIAVEIQRAAEEAEQEYQDRLAEDD